MSFIDQSLLEAFTGSAGWVSHGALAAVAGALGSVAARVYRLLNWGQEIAAAKRVGLVAGCRSVTAVGGVFPGRGAIR